MKRVEVRLAMTMVAPLLDIIKELAEGLRQHLAAPLAINDLDPEFREFWVGDLLESQTAEVNALLALFNEDFFRDGVVAFDGENAEVIVRACTAVRLRLRECYLKTLSDESLETGEVDPRTLTGSLRKAFMCYLFLATLQELIIKHLDQSILEG